MQAPLVDHPPMRIAFLEEESYMFNQGEMKLTDKERAAREAFARGTTLAELVRAHHVHPRTLIRVLELNPIEWADEIRSSERMFDRLREVCNDPRKPL